MKKMITLSLFIIMALGVQAQMVKFNTVISDPLNNAVLTYSVPFNQLAVVTVTQGNIVPTDTFAYIDPATPTSSAMIRTNMTKNTNDTILIERTGLTITNGVGNVFYCVSAFLYSGGNFASNFDTTGGTWRQCINVNIQYAASVSKYGELRA